jgi:hypothetical protein
MVNIDQLELPPVRYRFACLGGKRRVWHLMLQAGDWHRPTWTVCGIRLDDETERRDSPQEQVCAHCLRYVRPRRGAA